MLGRRNWPSSMTRGLKLSGLCPGCPATVRLVGASGRATGRPPRALTRTADGSSSSERSVLRTRPCRADRTTALLDCDSSHAEHKLASIDAGLDFLRQRPPSQHNRLRPRLRPHAENTRSTDRTALGFLRSISAASQQTASTNQTALLLYHLIDLIPGQRAKRCGANRRWPKTWLQICQGSH